MNDEMLRCARRLVSISMQRIAATGQNKIAEAIGTSEATVSRFIANDLERACQILAAVDLQVATADSMVVDPEEMRSLKRMAMKYLQADLARDEPHGERRRHAEPQPEAQA